jgi:hypothetical protein
MTDRQLFQQALDALIRCATDIDAHWECRSIDQIDAAGVTPPIITVLRERLAHCDRCGKKLGDEGDIHTCTPDPIGDAQDRLIAELAAQPKQEPYGWVQPNPSFNSGIFNQGAECPSGWAGSAIAVHTAPPTAQQIDEAYAVGYSNGMTEGYEAGKAYAAAQHQCKWPTCQSEEYQQALAEQINQELVTGAAQRQWVDLTDDDLVACSDSQKATVLYFMKKLKEKNT